MSKGSGNPSLDNLISCAHKVEQVLQNLKISTWKLTDEDENKVGNT